MNFRSIFSYLGIVLEILGILALLPIIVAFFMGENVYVPFFITAVVSFVLGMFLDKKFEKEELNLGSAMVLASLSFLFISIAGSVPYLFYISPIDSVFESVSGFTTTGLTVVKPSSLPYSLLFWRSFTQWIGGVGILVIFLLLIRSPGISSYYLYRAEAREEKIEASIQHTVKKTFIIFAVYTIIGILLLSLAGMPLFDSITGAFSSLSTGGFSVRDGSIGSYNNPLVEIIIIFLMVLGATSFFLHDKLLKGKALQYFKNPETKIFWFLIVLFSILLSISFISMESPVRHGIFHTFSALTTTGFTISGINSGMSKFLIIILMLIGGYAGSTAGGLKLVRFGIIIKSLAWLGKKISLPQEAVVPLKFRDKVVQNHELSIISLFFCIYIIILCISTVIIAFLGYAPLDSFFSVTSAQGTVGMSTIPIESMHWVGKIVLMINMLLGRLEILPFLVLFYVIYKTKISKESVPVWR